MIFDPSDPTPRLARRGTPPLKAAWPHGGRKPATLREVNKTRGKAPRDHYPWPDRRPADPVIHDSIRRTAMPILYGDAQNGYVVGAHALRKPPRGSDGCTVKTLDYRTPPSPERNRKGDRF